MRARQAAGLCRLCGAPQAPGVALCRTHQDRYLAQRRALYAKRKAAEICVMPGCGEKAANGFVRCAACHATYVTFCREYKRKQRAAERERLRQRRGDTKS